MQPLPNTSELADKALRHYYESQSNSAKSMSTYDDMEDPPFYKDISPKASNKSKEIVLDEEAEKEKYANIVL